MNPTGPFATLLDVIAPNRVARAKNALHIVKGGRVIERLTPLDISDNAARIAATLQAAGVAPAERVGLVARTDGDFVCSFFGVLAAGAVPVPLPPPHRFAPLNRYVQRIQGALARSRIVRLIDREPSALTDALRLAGPYQLLVTSDLIGERRAWTTPQPCDTALVQYTSGSTSEPKGARISHRALLANLDAMQTALRFTSDDTMGAWLPLYHDMGLIGCLLNALHREVDVFLMKPEEFITHPVRWLELFSTYRATISASPNMGYDHCVANIDEADAARLDLSSWRVAVNGAERVSLTTMLRFSEKFGRAAGFVAHAFLPSYGLAEATLGVTFPIAGAAPQFLSLDREKLGAGIAQETTASSRAVVVVGLGQPLANLEVQLMAGEAAVPSGKVGEICVRGASLFDCYDHDPENIASARSGGWFRTGDLGLIHDGDLYVTGRMKEMFIIAGRNYYAHDVEHLSSQVPGVLGAAALGLMEGSMETFAVIVEARTGSAEASRRLASAVREAVTATLGVTPRDVAVVLPGRLPRTTSGKLARAGLQEAWEDACALDSLEHCQLRRLEGRADRAEAASSERR